MGWEEEQGVGIALPVLTEILCLAAHLHKTLCRWQGNSQVGELTAGIGAGCVEDSNSLAIHLISTAQHSTAQHSTAQHSTAQHRTGQDRTGQDSTAQHSTAQHSTAQSSR